jgi:uncharacterized C2H2 Zn-finger protein
VKCITSISDFTLDGRIDWVAFKAAERANGELCTECAAFIFPGVGHPQKCAECREAEGAGELQHSTFMRCPRCGHLENAYERYDYEICRDGDHLVACSECEHEYTVETRVSFSFKSPARSSGDAA